MEERFILFRAAGEGFAFSLQEICEVLEPRPSYPIHGAPPHFTGLISFHGALTALVDFGLFLGDGDGQAEKVLVLDGRLAHLALSIEGVTAIVSREAIYDEYPGNDPLTLSQLSTSYGTVRLIRVEALLCALEEGLSRPPKKTAAVIGH